MYYNFKRMINNKILFLLVTASDLENDLSFHNLAVMQEFALSKI